MAEKTMVVVEKKTTRPVQKKVGRNVSNAPLKKGEEKRETFMFLASSKNHLLFQDDDKFIQFVNQQYWTNDKEEADWIRSLPNFNRDIWENEFPREYLEKAREDQKYLTRDETLFIPPEG